MMLYLHQIPARFTLHGSTVAFGGAIGGAMASIVADVEFPPDLQVITTQSLAISC